MNNTSSKSLIMITSSSRLEYLKQRLSESWMRQLKADADIMQLGRLNDVGEASSFAALNAGMVRAFRCKAVHALPAAVFSASAVAQQHLSPWQPSPWHQEIPIWPGGALILSFTTVRTTL